MWKKILLAVLLLAILIAGGTVGYLYTRKPASAPPLTIKVDMSPQRIARGKYLFENVSDCEGCHSQHDETRFGRPVLANGRGVGFVFPMGLGLPGKVVAPNITPDPETGIGNWTDGEKIRAIREGIGKDGRALFPMMPYALFRGMSDEDVQSMVAYMNTLPPVKNALPRTALSFPVSLLISSAPRPVGSVPPPDRMNKLKYGEYLATIAGCVGCHTQEVKGQLVLEKQFAGGREFRLPNGVVVTANISPDPETGIGRWSEQQFIEKFYQYKEYDEKGSPQVGPEGVTLMPWLALSRLPPEDLGAIYTYLKTQQPAHNAVETHPGFTKPPEPSKGS